MLLVTTIKCLELQRGLLRLAVKVTSEGVPAYMQRPVDGSQLKLGKFNSVQWDLHACLHEFLSVIW